ncbi:tetratricopeptide repeat protein [Thiomicrorhabdus arctica]|uniref:tetratricopeptide repeat protein n=1 Tax=Thiomicrorhabdus arctica TaxID=131540 RepID=UPI00037CB261|nr:surface lipoprotein assembly modifier [Thiomicrorhabdus arctica]
MSLTDSIIKTFSTLLLAIGLLFSQQLKADETDYKQALKLFNDKQYDSAYQAFTKLVESDYGSIKYNFLLARSATLTNRLDEAIIVYERILILSPNNTRSKLELGKLHYQQASYTLSESYFKSALRDNVPLQVEENIQLFLAKIKKTQNKSSLTGVLIVGIGHDTNANSAPYADSWYAPGLKDLFGGDGIAYKNTKEVTNNFHQETAVINHYYDATDEYGFGIKNNLLLYSKSLPGESDYNILFTRYTPSLIFAIEDYTLETALEYNYMHYGPDPYLQSYGIAPKIAFNSQLLGNISTQLKVLKKQYQQTADQERDALYTELNIQYQKLIGSKFSLSINTILQKERKNSGNRYDVDYDSISLLIAANYELSQGWRLGGSAGIKETAYIDNNPLFLDRRQDSHRQLALSATKRVSKSLSAQISASRTLNESNQEPYAYDKDVVTLNLIKRF